MGHAGHSPGLPDSRSPTGSPPGSLRGEKMRVEVSRSWSLIFFSRTGGLDLPNREEKTMTDDQPTTSRRRRGSGPVIRTHKVTVRLSPTELETVAGRAEAIGASVSRFLAESALTGTAPTLAERHG